MAGSVGTDLQPEIPLALNAPIGGKFAQTHFLRRSGLRPYAGRSRNVVAALAKAGHFF